MDAVQKAVPPFAATTPRPCRACSSRSLATASRPNTSGPSLQDVIVEEVFRLPCPAHACMLMSLDTSTTSHAAGIFLVQRRPRPGSVVGLAPWASRTAACCGWRSSGTSGGRWWHPLLPSLAAQPFLVQLGCRILNQRVQRAADLARIARHFPTCLSSWWSSLLPASSSQRRCSKRNSELGSCSSIGVQDEQLARSALGRAQRVCPG